MKALAQAKAKTLGCERMKPHKIQWGMDDFPYYRGVVEYISQGSSKLPRGAIFVSVSLKNGA